MSRTVGVLVARTIGVALVENNRLAGDVVSYPEPGRNLDLKSVPVEELLSHVRDRVVAVSKDSGAQSVGAGFPGIVRNGVIEESPNLQQLKGLHAAAELGALLRGAGMGVPVVILNDADALAAGIAATLGHLEKLIRV